MSSYLDSHDKRMASLRMSSAQFAQELTARGFVYDANTNRWNGPFGVSVPGDSPLPVVRDDLDRAYARGSAVRYADTQIAGRRKLV
jgi:hypothetical protein